MGDQKMAQKKTSKSTPQAAKKPTSKKPAAKQPIPAEEHEHEHVHDETCGCVTAAQELFGKNAERSYALRDLWLESLEAAVDQQVAPESNKREMLFLTLSNSILDMMMDILPEEVAVILAENVDDYLAVTLINQKYGVDLLKTFQDEFMAKKGKEFDTEDKLAEALAEFEEEFWNSPRKDLNGKSPNQVVEAALKHYDLI
jgi:hypothetical protein